MQGIIYLVITIENTAERSKTCQTESSAVLKKTSPAFILALSEESFKVSTSRGTTSHCCYYVVVGRSKTCVCIIYSKLNCLRC